MFDPPGWTKALRDLIHEQLRGLHFYNFYATLMTLEDQHVTDLPPIMAGSKIDIINPGAGHVCQVIVADTQDTLTHFGGANARKYLIRVWCQVDTQDATYGNQAWVVGTFAVQSVEADATTGTVTFNGASKSMLAQYKPLQPFTVPKGVKMSEAILRVMAQAGEARTLMNVRDKARVLKHDFTVASASPDDSADAGPARTFMTRARDLAEELSMDLLYRNDGTLLGRNSTEKSVFTFDKSWLVTAPKEQGDFSGFHNVVTGNWGKDFGEKPRHAIPPNKHKLSPHALIRRGQEYTQELVLEFPHERKADVVQAQCERRLRTELADALTVQGTVFPFPFLESGDWVTIGGSTVRPSWTLWLDDDTPMDIGWTQFAFLGPL